MIKSVDIFCAVIDNYGDIGVCWRLARQMAIERGLITRLYVDDMDSFKAIIPAPDAHVEVLDWPVQQSVYNAPDLVIEAFACNLPEQVIADMVRQKSVWIDLEYLTAENWALGCHALPSAHPSLIIKKTLFFPGFDENIGGLIRENDLISRRNAFFQDKNEQNRWRKAHFIPEIENGTIDISLFSYKTAPVDDLLGGLQTLGRKVRVFRPLREFKPQAVEYGENVKIIDIPFLPQFEYDYLLWTCDINFVRGEDSFVRAQFAGKPFIWNIYAQEKNAHLIKMDAFLERIKAFYDESSFESLANLHDLWNEGGRNSNIKPKDLWRNSLQSFVGLTTGARAWTDYLVTQTDLCTSLLAFAETQKSDQNR
jgi:uncharacterized repeat protein (TIGR03837 family)